MTFKQTCKQHTGQLVLAYHKKSLEYLCTKCIEKSQLKPDTYQVYSSVVALVREKIQAAKVMVKFRRIQLEQTLSLVRRTHK